MSPTNHTTSKGDTLHHEVPATHESVLRLVLRICGISDGAASAVIDRLLEPTIYSFWAYTNEVFEFPPRAPVRILSDLERRSVIGFIKAVSWMADPDDPRGPLDIRSRSPQELLGIFTPDAYADFKMGLLPTFNPMKLRASTQGYLTLWMWDLAFYLPTSKKSLHRAILLHN